MEEELLVQVAADGVEHPILAGAHRLAYLPHALEEGSDAGLVEVESVQPVKRRPVDRERVTHTVDLAQDAVLVGPPCGEARQPREHARAVGVEDVGAVTVHQHARVVGLVVGIAADVRARIDHVYAQAVVGQLSRDHAAGEAGADDENAGHGFGGGHGRDSGVANGAVRSCLLRCAAYQPKHGSWVG